MRLKDLLPDNIQEQMKENVRPVWDPIIADEITASMDTLEGCTIFECSEHPHGCKGCDTKQECALLQIGGPLCKQNQHFLSS